MPIRKTYRRKYRKTGLRRKIYKKVRTLRQVVAKVNKLQRIQRSQVNSIMLSQKGVSNISTPYTAFQICNFNALTPVFGSVVGDYNDVAKAYWKSLSIQFKLESWDEEENIQLTAFLVSLQPSASNKYDSATGILAALSDTNDYRDYNGMTMLNKKVFRVHRMKTFTLGNNTAALTTSGAPMWSGTSLYQGYWKIKPRTMIRNPTGNFIGLGASLDPTTQYYILVFNNNATGDLENPRLSYNILYNFTVDK